MAGKSNIKKNIIALTINTLLDIIDESSDSDCSDSDNEILQKLKQQMRVPRIRCKNYVENIVSLYTDMEFKTHFR